MALPPPALAVTFFPQTGNPFVDVLPLIGGALVILGTFMLFRARRKRLQSGGGEALSAREQIERHKQLRGVRGDLEELMVEIEQLAKRMSAQLDAKAVQLDRLIREAEVKVAQLDAAHARAAAAPQLTASAAAPPPPAAYAAPPVDPLTRRVVELHEQGKSSVDIARELEEHVGKVELILALRRQSPDPA